MSGLHLKGERNSQGHRHGGRKPRRGAKNQPKDRAQQQHAKGPKGEDIVKVVKELHRWSTFQCCA